MTLSRSIALAERGVLPCALERVGIRALLRRRLDEIRNLDQARVIGDLRRSRIAIATDLANQQHYQVPAKFFEMVLGPRRKYSGCYWPVNVETLAEAEEAALALVCERAEIADGQRILDLGCGWGSFTLYAAARFPNARIVAVSNSRTQAEFINRRRPASVEVTTADINDYAPDGLFDRIVSIEMFEHMRNYQELFARLSRWLDIDGRLFVHVFSHRTHAYPFETGGEHDWMGRYFFTGGLMPSLDLFDVFANDLAVERRWTLDGTHYQRTASAWRQNLEYHKREVRTLFGQIYGADAQRWFHRWRLFFLACEELFGYRNGTEWMVAHYLFRRQRH
jgi:cyclopropane-fatty-acyl-phospholipid synthase